MKASSWATSSQGRPGAQGQAGRVRPGLRVGLVLRLPGRGHGRRNQWPPRSQRCKRAHGQAAIQRREGGGLRRVRRHDPGPDRHAAGAAPRFTERCAVEGLWRAAQCLRRTPAATYGITLAYHHHMGAYVESPARHRPADGVPPTPPRRPAVRHRPCLVRRRHRPVACCANTCRARGACALQGRAPAGDRAGAQRRLELPDRRAQRHLHGAGRRRIDYEAVLSTCKRPATKAGWWSRPSRTRPWRPATSMPSMGYDSACAPSSTASTGREADMVSPLLAKARPRGPRDRRRHTRARGWTHVGFRAVRLAAGETESVDTGTARTVRGGADWHGRRDIRSTADLCQRSAPATACSIRSRRPRLYVPPGQPVSHARARAPRWRCVHRAG
jgi:hypothetical protein